MAAIECRSCGGEISKLYRCSGMFGLTAAVLAVCSGCRIVRYCGDIEMLEDIPSTSESIPRSLNEEAKEMN